MWDKEITKKLVDAGLSWEHARIVVGEIAEQRQIADRQGYTRGYNNGYSDAEQKYKSIIAGKRVPPRDYNREGNNELPS